METEDDRTIGFPLHHKAMKKPVLDSKPPGIQERAKECRELIYNKCRGSVLSVKGRSRDGWW